MTFPHARLAAAALFSAALHAPAHAAVEVDVFQTGSGVEIVYSGALDISGLTLTSVNPAEGAFATSGSGVIVNLQGVYDYYATGLTGGLFGTGFLTFASAASGDLFGFSFQELGVAPGYVSGTALFGQLTFAGETLLSMGFETGVYETLLPQDVIRVTVADIPLPAAAPLLLAGLGGLAALRRRRG